MRDCERAAADAVALTKQGKTPKEIIGELNRTRTVLPLRVPDYVALHDAGVAKEVLDYLQLAQNEAEGRLKKRYTRRHLPAYRAMHMSIVASTYGSS